MGKPQTNQGFCTQKPRSDGRGFPPGFRIDRIHAPLVRETFLHNGWEPSVGFSVEGKKQQRFWCFVWRFLREKYSENSKPGLGEKNLNYLLFQGLGKGYVKYNFILIFWWDGLMAKWKLYLERFGRKMFCLCWLLLGILHPEKWERVTRLLTFQDQAAGEMFQVQWYVEILIDFNDGWIFWCDLGAGFKYVLFSSLK